MTWECRDPTNIFFVDREVTWTGSKQGHRLACMAGSGGDRARGVRDDQFKTSVGN